MNKTDDQLRSNIEVNESRAEWSAWAVFAGLILEVLFAFAKSMGFEIKPAAENWGSVAADCLIALGVAGEVLFSRKARIDSDELTRRSEERVAEANTRASEANERAAKLEKETADARGRTAEIERLTAWRHVLPEQRRQIVDAISDMGALLDVLIEYERGDTEAFSYAREIWNIFAQSDVRKMRGDANSYLSVGIFGLRVAASAEINVSFISEVFSKAGIQLALDNIDLSTHLPRNVPAPNLYIFVAPKPPPAFVTTATADPTDASNNPPTATTKRE